MTETPYTLNEEQLERLLNITYYLTLCTYKTPMTPSEAARKLNVPANIAHYRTKKLVAVGLLEPTAEGSQKGSYQSVAEQFLIPEAIFPAVSESATAMLDGMLSKLHRTLITRTEQQLRDFDASAADKPLILDLSRHLDLSRGMVRPYQGACRISTVRMSNAQFHKVTKAIEAILEGVSGEDDETPCTLAFIAYDTPLAL